MSKEDWIVLRLLKNGIKDSLLFASRLDTTLAAQHLIDKYGVKVVHNCIDELKKEEGK